jgi:hypothetical protein
MPKKSLAGLQSALIATVRLSSAMDLSECLSRVADNFSAKFNPESSNSVIF